MSENTQKTDQTPFIDAEGRIYIRTLDEDQANKAALLLPAIIKAMADAGANIRHIQFDLDLAAR